MNQDNSHVTLYKPKLEKNIPTYYGLLRDDSFPPEFTWMKYTKKKSVGHYQG